MAVKATSSDWLADAAQVLQRVEQIKVELDNLSPAAQVAAFEKVQGENTVLIELQGKVQEAFVKRTHLSAPDLEPIEAKLKTATNVLESIESNIVLASNFIALAAQAESIFRQKPPQNVGQITLLHTRVTLLLNQSPNQGTRPAIEALYHKLLAILEHAPQEIATVELPKLEDPATLRSLKDALKPYSDGSGNVLELRTVILRTYSQIHIRDKEKILNAYNELRKSDQQLTLPSRWLTKLTILDWPGSLNPKLQAVEKVLSLSS